MVSAPPVPRVPEVRHGLHVVGLQPKGGLVLGLGVVEAAGREVFLGGTEVLHGLGLFGSHPDQSEQGQYPLGQGGIVAEQRVEQFAAVRTARDDRRRHVGGYLFLRQFEELLADVQLAVAEGGEQRWGLVRLHDDAR